MAHVVRCQISHTPLYDISYPMVVGVQRSPLFCRWLSAMPPPGETTALINLVGKSELWGDATLFSYRDSYMDELHGVKGQGRKDPSS